MSGGVFVDGDVSENAVDDGPKEDEFELDRLEGNDERGDQGHVDCDESGNDLHILELVFPQDDERDVHDGQRGDEEAAEDLEVFLVTDHNLHGCTLTVFFFFFL
jgi:hypothetical protein